jgi:hypothetical protein
VASIGRPRPSSRLPLLASTVAILFIASPHHERENEFGMDHPSTVAWAVASIHHSPITSVIMAFPALPSIPSILSIYPSIISTY